MHHAQRSLAFGLLLLCAGAVGFVWSWHVAAGTTPLTVDWHGGAAWTLAFVAMAGAWISVTAWRNRPQK